MKKYSPNDCVQIQRGDSPVNLLACKNGFWVLYEPKKYLKDEKNNLIVFPEKVCQLARARYILNHGKEEKDQKVKDLVEYWRQEVRKRIDKIKSTIDTGGYIQGAAGYFNFAASVSPDKFKELWAQQGKTVDKLKEIHPELEKMWEENNIRELLELFEIKTFENPILTARHDDEKEMQVLVNSFHKTELDKWNGDMLYIYARIEIEKEYSV